MEAHHAIIRLLRLSELHSRLRFHRLATAQPRQKRENFHRESRLRSHAGVFRGGDVMRGGELSPVRVVVFFGFIGVSLMYFRIGVRSRFRLRHANSALRIQSRSRR